MPLIPSPTLPTINGKRYDWSSVEIRVASIPFGGVKSVSYKHGLKPGEGRGTRAQVAMRSRGKYDASGSIELYKEEYQQLIAALSAGGLLGYMESEFDVVVTYAELGRPIIQDVLKGCRIQGDDETHSEGGEIATVKLDLHILALLKGGVKPVGDGGKFIIP